MRDIEDFLPRVLEKAPACPEPTAIRYIRDAAIEFCRRSRIWRSRDSFEIDTDGCDVVAAEQGTQLYEITHAEFDGCPLEAVTTDWLDKEWRAWRSATGVPSHITQSAPNSVRVVAKPEESGTLALDLILLPSQDCDQLPDILFDTYQMEIADGALSSILLLPAVEFANAQLGAMHMQKWNDELGRWSDRVQRGQQRAKRRTRSSGTF